MELLCPLVATLAALAAFQAYRRARASWEDRLFGAYGLRGVRGRLHGEVDGKVVRVEVHHGSRTTALVELPTLPRDLTLARDGPPEDPFRLRERASEVPLASLGWLRAEVRQLLEGRDRSLRDGALAETLPVRHEPSDLRGLLEVARRLAALAEVADPVARIAVEEPDPWVRARAMIAVGPRPEGALGRHPVTRLVGAWLQGDVAAMRAAHLDARLLGVSAVSVLERLDLRRASPARLGALLEALGEPELGPAEWAALADAAGRSGDGAVQDAFLAMLEADDPVGHAPLAFRVAASTDRPGAEEAVAAWTARARDPLPGLDWLARHGTVGSVPVVAALAARGPEREVARAARDAIQARAGGERGGLAVVELDGGELAPADPAGSGRLGAPEDRS